MITPEQREQRRNFIGSSDAAAILGLDRYRTAGDVWLEKTLQVPDFSGNASTDAGTLLEPIIAQWAEAQLGRPLVRDVFRAHPNGALCANFDAMSEDAYFGRPGGFIVEIKTTGIVGMPDFDYGDEGTDEVPERTLIQTHHQLAHLPHVDEVFVATLIGGRGFCLYSVGRNDDLVEMVTAAGTEFMQRHIRTRIPPDQFAPSLYSLQKMRRVPAKVVPIADEVVDRWIVAKAAAKKADADADAAQAALLVAMGDAEGAAYSRGRITYMETKRAGHVVKPSTFRQLRIKTQG